MPQAADTIGSWDSSQLQKVIRDMIQQFPPDHFTGITIDDLVVTASMTVTGKITYNSNATLYKVGTSGQVGFTNSWVKGGSPYLDPGYMKTEDAWCRLFGAVKNGTLGLGAFTLPPGFRPSATSRHVSVQNGAFGIVDVTSAGLVIPQTSNVLVSLDGIQFKTT